jgi:Doubled CXXCH motif (Paired_CXXCH_1)
MRRPVRTRSVRPNAERQAAPPGYWRDRLAVLLALMTVVCLGAALFLAKDTQFLMPGPLTSAHGAIEKCGACHTKSGSGQLSWIQGIVAGDPHADSKACLTCHKMPDTAFNAHGASAEVLKQSTERLTKVAASTPAPQWAHALNLAFPTHDLVAGGLYCATCHQEHQGVNFKLNKISNAQCHSCHVVKFDTFDGHHPEFKNYPFKRRTQIIFDHVGHFGKHFPEVAKKGPARRIPATCSTCHDSREDKRVMAVAPFEQTCTACHLGQITGKERASGPKGIAFLTLPGLDLKTLKKKSAPIGEWPAASEAELTPFMKVMISRNGRGRALIKTVESLNLQDLTNASDDQIKAVTDLVWEIKRLLFALISGKASDVLGNLNVACGAKLSSNLVADLTASIPRDVVVSAHQQWLPNLGTEMANRQFPSEQDEGCWITTIGGWDTTIKESRLAVESEATGIAKPDRPGQADQPTETKTAPSAAAKGTRIDQYGRLIKGREDQPEAARPEATEAKTDAANAKPGKETLAPDKPPNAKAADQIDDLLNLTEDELRTIKDAQKGATAGTIAKPDGGKETPSAKELPPAMKAGLKDAERREAVGKTSTKIAQADVGKEPTPATRAADQTDDLLNLTEEELRGIGAPIKDAEKAAQPAGVVPKPPATNRKPDSAIPADAAPKATEKAVQPKAAAGKTDTANAKPDSAISAPAGAPAATDEPQPKAAPAISIESRVDPESWAEYGGWYRQDYAIFYRPTGHKDKFIYSWLFLTGPQALKGDTNPVAAVFDFLASKDAPGSCTKCHSIDDIPGKGRVVNFSPPKIETKQGRFTNFIHEPHFGVLENRGCLTCHNLEKGRPYLQSYEHGNPKNFVSNFGAVKKELCQTCHTSNMARQDCLLCHKYHVNGVTTPIMNTKIPTE